MSEIDIKGEFITKFQDKQFLYFAERSKLGFLLIQRGHLLYYNKEFSKIFGYSQDDISKWKKREFYKIVHPEDLKKILQNFQIENDKTAIVQFRGITKKGKIIPIENYVCRITYNNKNAYLSSYVNLDRQINNKNSSKEKVKIEIEIPDEVYKFFSIRAIIKNKNLEEEISEFLIIETKVLKKSTFREAIF